MTYGLDAFGQEGRGRILKANRGQVASRRGRYFVTAHEQPVHGRLHQASASWAGKGNQRCAPFSDRLAPSSLPAVPLIEDVAVDESFNALLLVLTAVRNSRLRPPCAGSVHIEDRAGGSWAAQAEVHYGDMTWKFTDGSNSYSFTPSAGGAIESGPGNVRRIPRDRDDYLPEEIVPFFPLSMPIWGGMQDDFRVVGAEADATGVRLALVHMEDPGFTGSAYVDTEYGVVTEFETPALRLVVRDLGRLPLARH